MNVPILPVVSNAHTCSSYTEKIDIHLMCFLIAHIQEKTFRNVIPVVCYLELSVRTVPMASVLCSAAHLLVIKQHTFTLPPLTTVLSVLVDLILLESVWTLGCGVEMYLHVLNLKVTIPTLTQFLHVNS